MCEEEAHVVQTRPGEKAVPDLSDSVGGSVSCVLGFDAVVLDDGGDVSVPCGGGVELCGVDTVVPRAVSGCLYDLDSVSRGDLVVRADEMSLSGGGDAVVSGVDESVCYVNSVLADGIIDLCGVDTAVSDVDTVVSGVDTVVSGVDEYVCGVSLIMTADELDVCVCDSVVSDETGEVVSVDSVDDVVACGGDPLLPDAVGLGGRLSVVGDTLVCGAGVARSDRGDTDAMVGAGVAQRGWVDRLMCADDSLRPEPPPMYSMCLCRSLLAAA